MGLPKPPIKTMTDFIIVCFISVVVIVLIGSLVLVSILSFENPDKNYSDYFIWLIHIVSSLTSAIVGFLVGRGQGRNEDKS